MPRFFWLGQSQSVSHFRAKALIRVSASVRYAAVPVLSHISTAAHMRSSVSLLL